MRNRHTQDSAPKLRDNVKRCVSPGDLAQSRIGDCDRGIKVRAADGTEERDQRGEHGHRGPRIGDEGDGKIPAREPLSHDAGAYDSGAEQHRT